MISPRPIYLDYAATTPVDPRVAEKMACYLMRHETFGNPASNTHCYGWEASAAVEKARGQVAELISANPSEIIWTSGATESINLALQGASRFYQSQKKHLITVKTEHKAVLDTCDYLTQQGFSIDYLIPNREGLISLDDLERARRPDTLLFSLMHVNNETGVQHDLKTFGTWARQHHILFHVDAAQSLGKLPIDVNEMQIDLMSMSSHKIYGPKGMGALYVRARPRVRLTPLMYGGGQEQGLRAGTLATHQIVGMGEACAIAMSEMHTEFERLFVLREKLWQKISALNGVILNGHPTQRSAHHLNVSFEGVDGDALLVGLRGLAISAGSACTSASIEPSYVLKAMGVSDQLAHATVRLSLGRFTTEEEIEAASELILTTVQRLRNIAF